MKKLIWVLLGISVAVNLWQKSRTDAVNASASADPAVIPPAKNSPSSKTAGPASTEMTPEMARRVATLIEALVKIDSRDPAEARDQLRAAGADEATVYAVVDGMLRIRYYREKRQAEMENIRNGWWLGDPGGYGQSNSPPWATMVLDPELQLLGYDPHDIKDLAARFDFLRPEKAQTLAKMMVDYFVMSRRFIQENRLANNRAANESSDALVEAERQKDLQTLLTPEERAEYDLRFSDTAEQNATRFSKMRATEQEYRTISTLIDRLRSEAQAMPRVQNSPTTAQAQAQHGFDELVAAIGYDRAVDFAWTGSDIMIRDAAGTGYARFPAVPNSAKVLQLAAETGAEAAAIHSDATRSPDEKRAALLALQQSVQPKLEQILPPEARAEMDPKALGWFDGLAKGEYMVITPSLLGRGVSLVQPIPITAPARGAAPVINRPRSTK
jgi:hypothetical protein